MTIGYVLTWDGNPSSSFPEMINQKVSRGMVGGIRDQAVEVPGRDGSWMFEERRGNRVISVTGLVVADSPSDRHAQLVAIAEWLDKTGYRELVISDQPDRYWNASLLEDPNPDEWKILGKYEFKWTAEPYAYAIPTTSSCASATNADSKSFTIADNVDSLPIVEVTARGGSLASGFTLTVNGDSMSYAGSVPQNSTITISSLNSTVLAGANADLELTGAFVPGSVFPADVSGTFPRLIEGINSWSVQWSGAATYVDVCFKWRRRYR